MRHAKQQGTIAGYFASTVQIIFLLTIVFLIRTFFFGLYQVPTGSMENTMLVGERFFAQKISYWFTKPQPGQIIAFNDPTYGYSSSPWRFWFENMVWGPSNWTKRVIAIPGQTVKGVIEDNKPVIYVDGKKLDEPYVNTLPLLEVWRYDMPTVRSLVEHDAMRLMAQHKLSPVMLTKFAEFQQAQYIDPKTYDPSKPYDQQPFYYINPDLIVKGADGKPLMREPGIPLADHGIPTQRRGNSYWNGTDDFNVELGTNEYWLMGDNRKGSKDSRFLGPINGSLIHGQILFRIWSVDSRENWWILDLIKNPIDFFKRVRWNRFFQLVY